MILIFSWQIPKWMQSNYIPSSTVYTLHLHLHHWCCIMHWGCVALPYFLPPSSFLFSYLDFCVEFPILSKIVFSTKIYIFNDSQISVASTRHTWLRLKSTSNNYPTRKPLTLRLNYHKKVLGHLWEGLSKNVFVKNLFGCLLIDQNVSKNSYFHHR